MSNEVTTVAIITAGYHGVVRAVEISGNQREAGMWCEGYEAGHDAGYMLGGESRHAFDTPTALTLTRFTEQRVRHEHQPWWPKVAAILGVEP